MNANRNVGGCKSCDHSKNHHHDNDYNGLNGVVKTNAYNINGQDIIVLVVKDDIGPCCTDAWVPEYQVPKRLCCKFNSCSKPCHGGKY